MPAVGRIAVFAMALALLVAGAIFFSYLARLAVNTAFNLDPGAPPGAEVGGVIFEVVLIAPLVVWWVRRYRLIVASNPHR
jgi:hypothetical protein